MKTVLVDYSKEVNFQVSASNLLSAVGQKVATLRERRDALFTRVAQILPRDSKKKLSEEEIVVLMMSILDSDNKNAETIIIRELLNEARECNSLAVQLSREADNLSVSPDALTMYVIPSDKLEYWGL